MATHTLTTAAQFDQLPEEEGRKWELLDGELIEVSGATPGHSHIILKLATSLRPHVESSGGGVLSDVELSLGNDRRLRPDLTLFPSSRWQQIDKRRTPVILMPDIAVEIVSPSESASALERKVDAYLAGGIAEVWVVYPATRHVFVHTGGGIRKLADAEALASPLLPGWSLPVRNLIEI